MGKIEMLKGINAALWGGVLLSLAMKTSEIYKDFSQAPRADMPTIKVFPKPEVVYLDSVNATQPKPVENRNNFEQELDMFMDALSGQESGGNYRARNSRTGAYGRFQIMPANWGPWARDAGLSENAEQTPGNQEIVVRDRLTRYFRNYNNWSDVAAAWYGGPGAVSRENETGSYDTDRTRNLPNGEPSIQEYVNDVMERYQRFNHQ